MTRRCTICQHPKVDEINTALLGSETLNMIAIRFGNNITWHSLRRHRIGCLRASHLDSVKYTRADLIKKQEEILDKCLEKGEGSGGVPLAMLMNTAHNVGKYLEDVYDKNERRFSFGDIRGILCDEDIPGAIMDVMRDASVGVIQLDDAMKYIKMLELAKTILKNVQVDSADPGAITAVIADALVDYPEARKAVIAKLQQRLGTATSEGTNGGT